MLCVIMLSVTLLGAVLFRFVNAECHYAEFVNAEWYNAQCHYAESRSECHYHERHGAI